MAATENEIIESEAEPDNVRFLSPEEWWELFDKLAWSTMNMSGKEFVQRWKSGEYRGLPENQGAMELSIIMPDFEEP